MSRTLLIIQQDMKTCKEVLELADWKKLGFTKTDVRAGYEEGRKALLSYPYSLVLLDAYFHKRSGLELIRAARESGMCENFVLVTECREFACAREAVRLGVKDYLLRPVKRYEMESCVERILPEDTVDRRQQKALTGLSRMKPKAGVEAILEYIHHNYDDPDISLTGLANSIYVNPSYLGQRFRQQTGVKFTDYLNRYRIVRACELLLQDRQLTYEISEQVGFRNITYYHRVFRKVTGCSSEEYKKKAQLGLVDIPALPGKDPVST